MAAKAKKAKIEVTPAEVAALAKAAEAACLSALVRRVPVSGRVYISGAAFAALSKALIPFMYERPRRVSKERGRGR